MKKANIPLLLTYSHTKIQNFEIYRGAGKGTIYSEDDELEPTDIWGEEIQQKEKQCKELSIVIVDNTKLYILPYGDSYDYILDNGVYKIYDTLEAKWKTFGHKEGNRFIMKLGLIGAGDIRRLLSKYVLGSDISLSKALYYTGLNQLELFKRKRSLLAFCNVHYVFQ